MMGTMEPRGSIAAGEERSIAAGQAPTRDQAFLVICRVKGIQTKDTSLFQKTLPSSRDSEEQQRSGGMWSGSSWHQAETHAGRDTTSSAPSPASTQTGSVAKGQWSQTDCRNSQSAPQPASETALLGNLEKTRRWPFHVADGRLGCYGFSGKCKGHSGLRYSISSQQFCKALIPLYG